MDAYTAFRCQILTTDCGEEASLIVDTNNRPWKEKVVQIRASRTRSSALSPRESFQCANRFTA
eukprot:6197474-Pleurochrysis_carterae.AAC.3